MQGGKEQDWGYLVSMDRLDETYDNVTVPESLGKSQISGKIGQRGGSVRAGDEFVSDLGKWSHYLPSIGGNPPGK